jgi:F-type H+-transporting ATPase subunit delta
MNERGAAGRYARELFDVSWRHGQAETVATELETLVEATREYAVHVRPLFHPLVPKAKKLETIRRFSQTLGVSKPTAVLLEALAQHYRLDLLGEISRSFRERLNDKKGVVRARVTTAVPLAPEQAEALGRRLTDVTGRQVTLQTAVDPSIIGGVVTEVDSTVYDGSVTRQLARMREKLVENM